MNVKIMKVQHHILFIFILFWHVEARPLLWGSRTAAKMDMRNKRVTGRSGIYIYIYQLVLEHCKGLLLFQQSRSCRKSATAAHKHDKYCNSTNTDCFSNLGSNSAIQGFNFGFGRFIEINANDNEGIGKLNVKTFYDIYIRCPLWIFSCFRKPVMNNALF